MKVFIKWTLAGLLFLSVFSLLMILTSDFKPSRIPVVLKTIALGSLGFGVAFYLIETVLIPNRRRIIRNNLIRLFDAKQVHDDLFQLTWGGFDFIVKVEFRLTFSKYHSGEFVSFHLPRTLIDGMNLKPDFQYEPDVCNGVKTYKVLQTRGFFLKRAKRILEEKLGSSKQ